MAKNLYFFISTLGWFNGLILGIHFLFFLKRKRLSNILFGLMMLVLSIRLAKSVLWWFNPELPLLVVLIGLVSCMWIGPLFLYYVRSSLLNLNKLPIRWTIMLSIYGCIGLILLLFFSSSHFIPVWQAYLVPLIYAQWFVYIFIGCYELRHLFKKPFIQGGGLKSNEKWLLGVAAGSMLITAVYSLSYLDAFFSYIAGPVVFSLLLYVNVLLFLYQRRGIDPFEVEPEKYTNKKIPLEQAFAKIRELEHLMKVGQVYTNPDLKLNEVADLLDISGHQLSQLLNDNLGKNFTAFVNEFRILRACEIMKHDKNLKLEAVGQEVGFNSKSTFFASFKKYMGTTPKQFKEQVQ
jgi:AraC-like DNA-binding protein